MNFIVTLIYVCIGENDSSHDFQKIELILKVYTKIVMDFPIVSLKAHNFFGECDAHRKKFSSFCLFSSSFFACICYVTALLSYFGPIGFLYSHHENHFVVHCNCLYLLIQFKISIGHASFVFLLAFRRKKRKRNPAVLSS